VLEDSRQKGASSCRRGTASKNFSLAQFEGVQDSGNRREVCDFPFLRRRSVSQ